MEPQFIYELIGYGASLLVAISLMMSNIVRLRVINMTGAVLFVIYGLLIDSNPVAAMNAFIVLVNIYYLVQSWTSNEYFKLLRMSPENEFLTYFLDFYQDEIAENQPSFAFDLEEDDLCIFTLRNTVPAGLLIGTITPEGTLEVKLDYATPSYRDYKIGRFLFEQSRSFFTNMGINTIKDNGDSKEHRAYLKQMEFTANQEDQYILELDKS